MKRFIFVGGGILLILFTVFFVYTTLSDGTTPLGEGGEMRHMITVTYKDGNTKNIYPSPGLSFFNKNKEIDSINYIFQAKSENSLIETDISNYSIHIDIYDSTSTVISDYDASPTENEIVTVNTDWTTLTSLEINPSVLMSGLSSGTYHLILSPEGQMKYKIFDEWANTNLPDTIVFDIEKTQQDQLVLIFDSGGEPIYE